jgi:hypothetical protein
MSRPRAAEIGELMHLAEKMFSRSRVSCPIRSDCVAQSNQTYFDALFEKKWEVFVIQRDQGSGSFDWFTLCCETGDAAANACA